VARQVVGEKAPAGKIEEVPVAMVGPEGMDQDDRVPGTALVKGEGRKR
jgi:hypothetical protein